MTNEKFTKGEWSIADCRETPDADYDYSIVDADGWNIAHIENCNIEEQEANAHLIAAAPKMYSLLEQLHGALVSVPILQGEIEAVLKKARGDA